MTPPLKTLAVRFGAAFVLALPFAAHAAGDDEAAQPAKDTAAVEKASSTPLPAQSLTPGVLYTFLLAEIAGARGNLTLSSQLYLDLAQRTHDPRIARRATEIALYTRDLPAATQAARIWSEAEPGSEEARRILTGIIAGGGEAHLDDIQTQMARLLAQSPENLAQNLMTLNRTLARIQDKDAARKIVMRLTDPYLDYPEARFARAQASAIADDSMAALADADAALALRADWEPAIVLKAQIIQQAGNTDEAIELLRGQAARHPESQNMRLAYARALVSAKQYSAARDEFRRLLDATPNERDFLYATGLLSFQLEDYADAASLFERALAAGHPDADVIRLHLGQIAEKRNDTEGAQRWYRSVGPGPQYTDAQVRIALLLARAGKLDEARQHLQAQTDTDDETRHRYFLVELQLLRDAGQSEQALALADDALRETPDNTDLLYEAAMLAEKLDRLDIMENRLRKLMVLAPDNAHAYNALGYSLADRGQRLEEAEALIVKALELLPDDPFIIDSLGWVRFRRGDGNGAATTLERAYGIRQDPEIAAHLGEVLWSLDRRDEANRIFDKALAAQPDNKLLRETVQRLRHP